MFFSKGFNPDTDIPSLKGKVIIVTGANTGIGFATVQHLARHGAKVYLGARSEKKANAAIEQLKKEGLEPGNGEVIWLNVDLSEPEKAKAAAEAFLQKEKRLDVLINNAALMMTDEFNKTHHGVQDIMVVNHISPFVFTRTLLPLMNETAKEPDADVRIVVLSSEAINFVPKGIRFQTKEDLNREYADLMVPSMRRYGMSKLANVLYVKQLQKNLIEEGSPITVIAVHPGAVNSGSNTNLEVSTGNDALVNSFGFIKRFLLRSVVYLFVSTTKGSYTSVFAAASPEVKAKPESYKGAYLVPVAQFGKLTQDAASEELAKELWDTTEEIVEEIGL